MSRRIHRRSLSLLGVLIALAIGIGQSRGLFGPTVTEAVNSTATTVKTGVESNQPGLYHIVRFSDGDTITVDMNGSQETVRFIGVDTPETHDPRKKVQCGGPAASAYTKNSLTAAGSKVRLAADSMSGNRDRYGRLLRYVYLPDGTFWNLKLIQDGYGFYYPYFKFDKKTEFAAAQKQAQAAYKGVWGNCHPIGNKDGGYTSNEQ